jgi:thioredoxin 1
MRSTEMVDPVDDLTFDATVIRSSTPVLVEFGAEWCPPCRMLAPILEEVAAERASTLRIVSVDVDASPVTQARYSVMSVPTMLLFAGGKPVRQIVGYMPKGRLLEFVDTALEGAVV